MIRRELLLEEGQVYNSQLWELSLLRLNQLQYFNPLKVEQDPNPPGRGQRDRAAAAEGQEKGKNTIGLNGGVSGLSGAFLGLNYQTNNFLGLGETLSVQASLGNLARNLSSGSPSLISATGPLSLGFQLFTNKTRLQRGQELQADYWYIAQRECRNSIAGPEL